MFPNAGKTGSACPPYRRKRNEEAPCHRRESRAVFGKPRAGTPLWGGARSGHQPRADGADSGGGRRHRDGGLQQCGLDRRAPEQLQAKLQPVEALAAIAADAA
jgi:hypothetical protein